MECKAWQSWKAAQGMMCARIVFGQSGKCCCCTLMYTILSDSEAIDGGEKQKKNLFIIVNMNNVLYYILRHLD